MDPLRVGILIYEGVSLLEVAEPFEVLRKSRFPIQLDDSQNELFEVFLIAQSTKPVMTDIGVPLIPHMGFEDNPYMDVFIIPGGKNARMLGNDAPEIYFIQLVAEEVQPIATVSTGAFLYARAGLGQGRYMTTHFQFVEEFHKLFPDVKVKYGYRYLDDGPIISSAGPSCGLDLGLYLVYKYYGVEATENTSRLFEYHFTP